MGRFFSPIHSNFWTDPLTQKMNPHTKLLACFLLSNHHSNGAGFYYFDPAYGASDLSLPLETVEASLQELADLGFIMFNPESKALFVLKWFLHNPVGSSKNADHFVKLYEQNRLPQNEPEVELEFFKRLHQAAKEKEGNSNFYDFFRFLGERLGKLDPDAPSIPIRNPNEEGDDYSDVFKQPR